MTESYTPKVPLNVEEFKSIKDGSFVQFRIPEKPGSPLNMNIGPICESLDGYKKISLLRKQNGTSYDFVLNADEYSSGKFFLYKLISEPIHKLIEGMKIEFALSMLEKQINREICVFVPDISSFDENDMLTLMSPHVVKSVISPPGSLKIEIDISYKGRNSFSNNFIYAMPGSSVDACHLYIYDSVFETREPKNNQGRSTCFWCNSKTKQVAGISSFYDVCTKCGK